MGFPFGTVPLSFVQVREYERKRYIGSTAISLVSISFCLTDYAFLLLVVLSMILSFREGSAHMIIRSIHSILGLQKWVKPQGFFPFSCSVFTRRLKATIEFQFLFSPFGMVCVSLRRTFRYLHSGLINSAKYS